MTLLTLYLSTTAAAFLVCCVVCYINYQDNSLDGIDIAYVIASLIPLFGAIIGVTGLFILLIKAGNTIAHKLLKRKHNKRV